MGYCPGDEKTGIDTNWQLGSASDVEYNSDMLYDLVTDTPSPGLTFYIHYHGLLANL